MKRLTLIAITYFFLSSIMEGQTTDCLSKAYTFCQNKQVDSSLFYFSTCDYSLSDSIRAGKLYELGKCFYYKDHEEEALKCYKELLAEGTTVSKWTGQDSSSLYGSIGSCYYYLSKYISAVNAFDLGINSEKNKINPNSKKIVQLLIKKSSCFSEIGAYEKAESTLEKGMIYCYETPKGFEKEFGKILIKLADILTWREDYTKAISYVEQYEQFFFQQDIKKDKDILIALKKIGNIYLQCEEYESAYRYYERSIPYYHNNSLTHNSNAYRYMGDCQFYLKKYHKAIDLYQKSISILQNQEASTYKKQEKVNLYSRLGACYTYCEEYEKAAEYLDEVLQLENFSEKRKNIFLLVKDKKYLLTHLYFKAKNHLKSYDKSQNIEDLLTAQKWYDICIQLIDNIFQKISLNSQQYFLNNAYYIYEGDIETNYQLYLKTGEEKYISVALFYAEKSRSILLKEVMREASAKIRSGVPDSVFSHEKALKNKQAELENVIFNEDQHLDKATLSKLKVEVAELKQKRKLQNDLIQKKYPNYAHLLTQKDSLNIADVRHHLLRPDEILLHYFVGDTYIYILSISASEAKFVRQKKEKSFAKDIEDLRTSIYNYALTEADSALVEYKKRAFSLYKLLIQPLELPPNLDILIIPDGLLEYLPFDALLKAEPASMDFASFPYLVLDYNIRYLHSGLLGIQQKKDTGIAKHRKVLAIAPSFTGKIQHGRRFSTLHNNIAEVNNIKKHFAVKILKGDKAMLSTFNAMAEEYACLHLATHAIADNENGERSFLAFSAPEDTATASVLYARDISLMDLHADMVVLSACETAVGNLRRGEGIISLARAFSYAGAESLLTTLWRVSDDESEIFMDKFYEGLQLGQPKNEALRNAKLHFIQHETPRRAHPFFWAAYVPLGEMNPIVLDAKTDYSLNPWWLLLVLPLVLILVNFYKKKNAHTHRN